MRLLWFGLRFIPLRPIDALSLAATISIPPDRRAIAGSNPFNVDAAGRGG
jgi:hypothetical protein